MRLKHIIIAAAFLPFATNAQNAGQDYAFKPGEKLQYDAYYNWGFIWITAAKVDFTVQETTWNKTPVYCLKMAGKTVNTFGLFNFTDTAVVYVNKKTMKPYYFREASHEPDYYTIDRITYFSNDTAKWGVVVENERKRGTKYDTITSNKTAYYDLLTTLYNLRNMNTDNWTVNQKTPLPMIFSDETFDLYLRYVGKEQIKLKNGKSYNCIKVKPLLAEGKMFDKGEGMTIWISDDRNHIPLMIESKLKIGSLKAQLIKVENNAHPIAETKKK